MDTSVKLYAIALLSVLAGCATEHAGQYMDVRRQDPPGRVDAQTIVAPEAREAASAGGVPAPQSGQVDNTRMAETASPKPAAGEAGKLPSHAYAIVPTPQITKSPQPQPQPQPEAKKPQPVVRWSRQLTVSQERFLERNENSLLRVYIDMSKAEVMSIMSDYRSGDWVNPCKQEKLMDNNGKIYDVIFYLSRRPVQSRPFNERLMTPVILRDNRVYAIGRYSLKKLRATSHLVDSASIGCQHV